jgi:hypothetical protein
MCCTDIQYSSSDGSYGNSASSSRYVVDTLKDFFTPLRPGIGFDYSRKQSVPMIHLHLVSVG